MASTISDRMTPGAAARLAHELYGLACTAMELPGERDRNFLLTDGAGSRYVLKIAQASDDAALLEAQNEVLLRLHAARTGFSFPRVLPLRDGEPLGHAGQHWVRLVEYLPGRPLATVRPHTSELLQRIGALFGTVDRVLYDFTHPAVQRELVWDLAGAAAVIRKHRQLIPGERRRHIEHALELIDGVQPVLAALRSSTIHNDGNDYNILVETPGPADPFQPVRPSGLIDFGDLLHTYTIAEPAIACAYAMLDKPDPLGAAADLVSGYHREFAIPEHEFAALYPLIVLRLALSVTLSAVQRRAQPENEYLSISEAPAWALLERLSSVHADLAHYRLRAACGFEPCPAAARVVSWLQDNAGHRQLLPEHDLNGAHVFDFSVQSLEFGEEAGSADPLAWQRAVARELQRAGAATGLGRYDEARPWYTAPLFGGQSNSGPDWRSIHIGVDLFAAAGTAVSAPFDGIVHSFRDNAGHLDYGPTIILQHDVAPDVRFFTLYGHLSRASLDGLSAGTPVRRGERFATLGAADVNGGWAPHLHFQIVTDLLGRAGEFPGVARPSDRAVWLSLSPDPNLILRLPQLRPAPRIDGTALLAERHARIGPSLSVSYRKPLTIVRGWMQHLYDADGQPYLDAVNNVAHVGHSHPRVVRALREQSAVLNTNSRYLHPNLVRYAERLTATLPEPLSVCFFVCSGSEANELALRMARAHTGAHDVVVIDAAYHGNTTSLIELSPYKFNGAGGAGRAEHVQVAALPDVYRGRYRGLSAESGRLYAEAVRAAIERVHERGQRLAAFFAEPLPGCGGQIVLPESYLEHAFAHVRAAGGICIADEVQTGLGRMGTHFWAFETQHVVPDIVTIGKPAGNGHPLAAVVTTPAIAASFANGMEYFNTFGGNPVSCAVGLAVLDVIRDQNLQQHALETGTHLRARLRELESAHEIVGDVRGIGLYIGVELVVSRESRAPAGACASYVANRMRERGILISTDGPHHNVLKIKPPLVFTRADADRLADTLDEVLHDDAVQLRPRA